MIPVIAGFIGAVGGITAASAAAIENEESITDSGESLDRSEGSIESKDSEEELPEASVPSEDDTENRSRAGRENSSVPEKTAGGVAVGAVTEAARRAGVDRHAESGLAEYLHAKAYAGQVGGTVVDNGESVFAPDGPCGVDKRVMTEAGERTIQSKHFQRAIGDSTLADYADVDVIATTNGVRESANPEEYGVEVITSSDWSLWARAKLEGTRVWRGIRRGLGWLAGRVSSLAGHFARVGKAIASRLFNGAKIVSKYFLRLGKAAGSKFLRLPLGKQLLIIAGIVSISYLIWRWYRDDDAEETSHIFGILNNES